MARLYILEPYQDQNGNVIEYDGTPIESSVSIRFQGAGNVLAVAKNAKVADLNADFVGDGGRIEIGATTEPRVGIRAGIRVGHGCSVVIGPNVGIQTRALIVAAEGTDVVIGADCMFASNIEIRTEDSHAIYDVRSGRRANMSRSIHIGDHVWIGKDAVIMGGVSIGSGSVVGLRSVVTRSLPNNSICAGVPARIVRRHIAWERPMLSQRRPGVGGLPPGDKKTSDYWHLTSDDDDVVLGASQLPELLPMRLKRAAKRVLPNWFHAPARSVLDRFQRVMGK